MCKEPGVQSPKLLKSKAKEAVFCAWISDGRRMGMGGRRIPLQSHHKDSRPF